MSAVPGEQTHVPPTIAKALVTPFPGSKKIYVKGQLHDIQVPMRQITLTSTPTNEGLEANAPVTVYDTSGPYTDPNIEVDLCQGLSRTR